MLKYLGLVGAIAFLSGCNHLSIQNFERSPYSFVSNNKAGVFIINGASDLPPESLIGNYLKETSDFKNAVETKCSDTSDKKENVMPALIPLASSFGKFLFDMQMDKNTREIEKLKKAAQATYSSKVILPSGQFIESSCAVLFRFDEENKSIGFVSVLKVEKKGEGFVITPVYIKANNTVAVTKRPETGEAAKINVSIAVSVKAIGTDKNGLPQLVAVGEGVTTVVNIDVGPNEKAVCVNNCYSSDLVPYLTDSKKIISVSFAITETGKLGIDLDEKLSEIKAIKEAIGPALKDSLNEYLKED